MKKHSLSSELFRAYIGWFIFFIIILLCVSIGFIAFSIRKDFTDTQNQLINSIDENVQNYFEEMNAFSMELMNSREFKEVAINQLPGEYEAGKSTAESFSKLYQDAYKMIQKNYNVGIVVNNQYYIWMGRRYHIHRIDSSQVHTYDDLVRNEKPVIKYLDTNKYLESIGAERNGAYITLSRSMDIKNQYVNGRQILEILIEAEDFADDMRNLSGAHGAVQINIFDSEGNALYQESALDLSKYVNGEEKVYRNDQDLISVRRIFNDNLTMVYTRNSSDYLKTLKTFWFLSISIGVVFIGIILWNTYRISRKISRPIRMICEQVDEIGLKEGKGYQGVETNIDELQFLSNSIKEMSENLQKSLEQIIALKEYELHAKMLALQAQMQPHFLFNTLMNIASMAEEEGNDRIYRICMNLTSMFRYISADNPKGVCMYEEIRHVEHYIEIMKERFPESRIEIDIPLELMSVLIPKLTIQPLVENAFKYCNRQRPEIKIHGIIEQDGSWTVEVEDNGDGFSREKKEEIIKKCGESLENENALSNQIDGMGLVNVFVRLELFYGKESLVYSIEENQGKVVVGRRNREDG